MNRDLRIALDRLDAAETILLDAQNMVTRARRDIVDAFCTIKIGDVVPVNGYSHHGKMMKVERLSLQQTHSREQYFKAWGTVLKKDGTLSVNKGESTWDFDMKPLGKMFT